MFLTFGRDIDSEKYFPTVRKIITQVPLTSGIQSQCDGSCMLAEKHVSEKSFPRSNNTACGDGGPIMSHLSTLKKTIKSENFYEAFWFIYLLYRTICFEILRAK